MPYIIDGHNTIPQIPGLSLQDIDDEMQLVEMLQEFCRLRRKTVEVYFDNAPSGQMRVQKFGRVTAFFPHAGQSADQAIQRKLERLGNEARNWNVVSSDREVQAAARAARAKVTPAQDFAEQLLRTVDTTDISADESEKPAINSDDIDEWLKLFGESNEGE